MITVPQFVAQKVWKVAAGLLVAAVLSPAARADVLCTGTVQEFLMYADGTLLLKPSWRGDWTQLCSTQGAWNGVATETCFGWYSMVAAAKVHNAGISVYYPGTPNCATLPTYSGSLAPIYLRMQ